MIQLTPSIPSGQVASGRALTWTTPRSAQLWRVRPAPQRPPEQLTLDDLVQLCPNTRPIFAAAKRASKRTADERDFARTLFRSRLPLYFGPAASGRREARDPGVLDAALRCLDQSLGLVKVARNRTRSATHPRLPRAQQPSRPLAAGAIVAEIGTIVPKNITESRVRPLSNCPRCGGRGVIERPNMPAALRFTKCRCLRKAVHP